MTTAEKVMNAFYRSCLGKEPTFKDDRIAVASAIRALMDDIMSDEPHPGESHFWDDEADREWQTKQHLRKTILTTVNKLEEFQ